MLFAFLSSFISPRLYAPMRSKNPLGLRTSSPLILKIVQLRLHLPHLTHISLIALKSNFCITLSLKKILAILARIVQTSLKIIDFFKIRMPHADKPLKEAYTEEELSKLLKKPNLRKCSFAEYRSWVMVNYFLSTGQRMNSV